MMMMQFVKTELCDIAVACEEVK